MKKFKFKKATTFRLKIQIKNLTKKIANTSQVITSMLLVKGNQQAAQQIFYFTQPPSPDNIMSSYWRNSFARKPTIEIYLRWITTLINLSIRNLQHRQGLTYNNLISSLIMVFGSAPVRSYIISLSVITGWLVGWLAGNAVFSERSLRIFLILCMKLGDYKGRKITEPNFRKRFLILEIFHQNQRLWYFSQKPL